MDRSLPIQFIALLSDWSAKCFVCVRSGIEYSCWFKILAGVRQGGIFVTHTVFCLYPSINNAIEKTATWL